MFNIVVSELDQDYRPNRSLWRQSKSNVKRNDITAEGKVFSRITAKLGYSSFKQMEMGLSHYCSLGLPWVLELGGKAPCCHMSKQH